MRSYDLELDVPATPDNGAATTIRHLDNGKAVYFDVTSGEYRLEVSPDGSTFTAYDTVVNSDRVIAIPFMVYAVRVVCLVAGTATARATGFQSAG